MQEKEIINQDASKELTKNDTFAEVLGKDRNGQVRMYGLGVCPSTVWGDKSTHEEDQDKDIGAMKAKISNLTSQVEILTIALLNNKSNDIAISSQVIFLLFCFELIKLCILVYDVFFFIWT